MKTEKTYWNRLVEFVVRRRQVASGTPALAGRQPMDAGENDKMLVAVREEDPAWRVLMNYAYVHVENNLGAAFDSMRTPEQKLEFTARAAGVAAFITDVESTRARLREDLLRRQKAEERKKG